ncbi:MAG: YfbM family protein [Lachnospiraceae bacterium]|nr:YfbM family protein [Lachnospiraceae bacterium]
MKRNGGRKIMGMTCYYLRANEETIQRIQEGSVGDIAFDEEGEQNLLDIDKAWHAIHFILTGCVYDVDEDDILSQLVLGGIPVSEEDMGYGPARLIGKETVAQLAEALKEWNEETFRENFDMKAMKDNDIYPMMSDEDDEMFYTYVWENFAEVKKYFQEAAEKGESIITFLA